MENICRLLSPPSLHISSCWKMTMFVQNNIHLIMWGLLWKFIYQPLFFIIHVDAKFFLPFSSAPYYLSQCSSLFLDYLFYRIKKNRGKIKWHVFNDIEDVLHHTVTYLVLIVVLFSLFDLDPIRCTCLCAITTIITKMHRPSRCKFKFDITSWILTINRSVIWTSLPDFLSPLGFTNFAHIQSISIDFFLPLSAIRTANQPWRISFILPEACSTLLALIFTIGVNRPSCSTKGTLSYLS